MKFRDRLHSPRPPPRGNPSYAHDALSLTQCFRKPLVAMITLAPSHTNFGTENVNKFK